jgi:hypothetical protein
MLLHIFHSGEEAGLVDKSIGILTETVMITYFVLMMMLLIEYVTVLTRGRWPAKISTKKGTQIFLAALLGIIPGCLGSFTSVSLYIHRTFNFTALNTTMIATSGDEAFIMFSMIPKEAFLLNGILFLLALATGYFLSLYFKGKNFSFLGENDDFAHYKHPDCHCFEKTKIIPQLIKISFVRTLLLALLISFIVLITSGTLGHDSWNWHRITFLVVTVMGLFIVLTVPDEFLENHLWRHTIKVHIPRIFLWTLGAFIVIEILLVYFHAEEWLGDNLWMILIVSLLVGIIPQSGPNIIFITLFAGGHIPFSILLANSIVQDGHGALPLLAESKKSFFLMKLINVIVGFLAGTAGLLAGF